MKKALGICALPLFVSCIAGSPESSSKQSSLESYITPAQASEKREEAIAVFYGALQTYADVCSQLDGARDCAALAAGLTAITSVAAHYARLDQELNGYRPVVVVPPAENDRVMRRELEEAIREAQSFPSDALENALTRQQVQIEETTRACGNLLVNTVNAVADQVDGLVDPEDVLPRMENTECVQATEALPAHTEWVSLLEVLNARQQGEQVDCSDADWSNQVSEHNAAVAQTRHECSPRFSDATSVETPVGRCVDHALDLAELYRARNLRDTLCWEQTRFLPVVPESLDQAAQLAR